jgi:lysophospholipase L1-like esterase
MDYSGRNVMRAIQGGCDTETIGKRRPPERTAISVIGVGVLMAFAVGWAVQPAVLRVVIIGDSTVQTYTASDPKRGWGQEIGFFFNKGAVTIINKSIGGRSSRSFIEDGHWASTLAILQKGDFLFIQFGHNDRDTKVERYTDTAGYRKYLTQYVTESRAKGAIPVLVSPMNMNAWNGSTMREVFNEGANDYHAAMLRVVNAQNVPFIDLEQKTATIFRRMGQAYLAAFIFNPGEGTHFQEMGALLNARCVAEGIKELANHTDVGKLAAVLGPQYLVTITPNKTGAGMITESGSYPPGAPLTIKVVPNSGQTFQRWQDADGKTITTGLQFLDTVEAAPVSYNAMYSGGTAVAEKVLAKSTMQFVTIRRGNDGMVAVKSRDPILAIRLTDLSGRAVNVPIHDARSVRIDGREISGVRAVTVTTPSGSRTRLVPSLR